MMSLRRFSSPWVFGAIASMCASANIARAAEAAQGTALNVGTKDTTLGLGFRADLDHNDHGLLKADGIKPTKTTTLDLNTLKLMLKSKVTDTSDVYFKFDFAKPGKGKEGLEYARATWWVFPVAALVVGKDRVNQAGWENKESSITTLANSQYVDYWGKSTGMPFAKETPLFGLNLNFGDQANVNLQAVNDVVVGTDPAKYYRAHFNDSGKQPAWTLEYTGTFGPVSPLLQYGSYDLNHSKFMTVGVKASVNGLTALVDHTIDNMQVEIADKKETTTITNTAFSADYTMNGVAKPFAKFAMFNVKDAKTDVKGNAADTGKSSWEGSAFGDNSQLTMLGVWGLTEGSHFMPYLAFVSRSGKFLKAASTETTEVKTETHIRFGVAGEI